VIVLKKKGNKKSVEFKLYDDQELSFLKRQEIQFDMRRLEEEYDYNTDEEQIMRSQ
jgi:hypothetical protein